MVLYYQEYHKLTNGHTRGITKVVFSPDGTYLATGGLDGRICVWNVENGELRYAYSGVSEVLELVWPSSAPGLMCGLADGHIAWMSFSGDAISVSGFFAQKYPVECLAPHEDRLASGAGPELSIWRWDAGASRYAQEVIVDEPPKNSHNDAKEVVVTSIHWIPSQERLAVTYLNHGIVLFDYLTWSRVRTFPMNGLIASASISEDGSLIAISNVDRGFDIYSLSSGDPLCTIDHKITRKVPTPAIWIHGGYALLCGTTTGKLTVWDIMAFLGPEEGDHPAEVRILYELPIPKQAEALAIAAHYLSEKDEFLIAAGVMNVDSPSPCIIWKTEDQDQGHRTAGQPHDVVPEDTPYQRSSPMCSACFAWTVTFICFLVLFQTWSGSPVGEL